MEWETVVGKTKKNKQNGDTKSKMSKDEKMKMLAKAPKFEELKTATDTKFSVLDVEKPKETEMKKEKSATPVAVAASPKKAEREKPKAPKTIEEAIKQLNHHELVTHMDNVKKRFSNSSEVLLDELASYLNTRLVFEGSESSNFLEKPATYLPSCLSKETKKYLEQLIRSQENRLLEKYFLSWVKGMAQDMAKSRPVNGYKLLLSLLLVDKHTLDEDQLVNITDLCDVYKNQPKIILTIFWAVGNAGRKDVKTGFNVWKLIMSNFLQFKNYSKPATDYLTEQLAKLPEEIKKTYLTERDYFKLFDQLYPSEGKSQLPIQTHKTLIAEMPRIRSACYGNKQETLRNYFVPYLERLTPTTEDSVKSEILDELLQCLRHDTDCYKVWENQFKNYLDQSAILLDYLVEKQSSLPRHLIRPVVSRLHEECSDVIETFHEQQQTGSRFKKHKKIPEGYHRCLEVSKKLLDASIPRPKKRKASGLGKWNWTLLFLLAGVVYYDTSINGLGSFEDSRLGQFCRHSGLSARWTDMYGRTSAVLTETHRHLLEYYPAYYGPVRDAGVSVWDAGVKGLNHASHLATNVYVWFAENIPVAVDRIEETLPGTKERVSQAYINTISFVKSYATLSYDAALPYAKSGFATTVDIIKTARVHIQNGIDYIIPQAQQGAEWVKANVFRYEASWEELRADVFSALKIFYLKAHESYHKVLHMLGLCSGH